MFNARKRTLHRLKERFLISITPIPRVYIRVKFRLDGSYHLDFGYKGKEYLVKNKLAWHPDGKATEENMKWGWFGGQDYTYREMWRYIQYCAYHGMIHPLDLVNNKL